MKITLTTWTFPAKIICPNFHVIEWYYYEKDKRILLISLLNKLNDITMILYYTYVQLAYCHRLNINPF